MHTQEIHVAGGRDAVSEIRRQLFVFPEVLDVVPTSRSDSLVVVVSGQPRPAEWTRHLNAAGYEVLGHPARSAGPAAGCLVVGQLRSAAAEERAAATGYRRLVAGRHRGFAATPAVPFAHASATQSQPRASSGG